MLFLSAIPHHHHLNGVHCFKVYQVEHSCDKEHESHHNPTTNNNSENSHCIIHSNFIIQHTDDNVRIKSLSINYSVDNGFDCYFATPVKDQVNFILDKHRSDYCEYPNILKSQYKPSSLGLRAPPFNSI